MTTATTVPPKHAVGPAPLIHALKLLATRPTFEARRPTEAGVRYRTEKRRGLAPLADVYLPEGEGPFPSVVLVHGGGFLIGSRGMKPMKLLATRLAEAGFAAATFDYRMIGRGGRLDAAVDDVRAMLSWWGGRADAYGLDPDRVCAAGLSAGATLMLLASEDPPIPLAHLVSVFALYDLAGLHGRLPGLLGRLLMQSRDRAVWSSRSPMQRGLPPAPLTMIHGSEDRLTPVRQAEDYLRRRDEAGLDTTLHVYPGAEHGFFCESDSPFTIRGIQDLLAAVAPAQVGASPRPR